MISLGPVSYDDVYLNKYLLLLRMRSIDDPFLLKQVLFLIECVGLLLY